MLRQASLWACFVCAAPLAGCGELGQFTITIPTGTPSVQLSGNGVVRGGYAYGSHVSPEPPPAVPPPALTQLAAECARLGANTQSPGHGADGDICELLNVEVDKVMASYALPRSDQPALQRYCGRELLAPYYRRTQVRPVVCWRLEHSRPAVPPPRVD